MTARTPARRSGLLSSAVAVAALLLTAAACTPAPGTTLFEGGTYDIDVVIPPQSFSSTFDVFEGLGTCTVTATTPSVDIPDATLTLPPAELDLAQAVAVIPSAVVELPSATVSVGSVSLSCFGFHLFTVGFSISVEGSVSVQQATLDITTGKVVLADPTLTVTDAWVTFAGAPPEMEPVRLDPFTVTIPSIDVRL